MYTTGNPAWSNNPYETRDPRKFVSISLLCLLFVLHIVSGAIVQATTNFGTDVHLFSRDDGIDNGTDVFTYFDCGNGTWLVVATIAFVGALIKIMICIGLMIMNFVRTFNPHAAVMVLMMFTAMSLTAQPVAILIFKFQAQNCWSAWNVHVEYTLGGGFILACFLPPIALCTAIPSYMMYKAHLAITQQRQLEIQEALVGSPQSPSSPANSPMNQSNVVYMQQPQMGAGMVYMTQTGGNVMYVQQPTVMVYQQPQPQQQYNQPQQQSPYASPTNQQSVVMGVEVQQ